MSGGRGFDGLLQTEITTRLKEKLLSIYTKGYNLWFSCHQMRNNAVIRKLPLSSCQNDIIDMSSFSLNVRIL